MPQKTEQAKEKQKETCLERYGTKCPLQNENVKEKTIQTNIKKYGVTVAQYNDNIKTKIANSNKETCLRKYNVENIMFVDGIKDKMHQTMVDRYGVSNYIYSKEYAKRTEEIYHKIKLAQLSELVKRKKYNTHKKRKTFNNSKIETHIENYFIEHNINYISQYTCERYPFTCDFYLIDYDLFIEIQGSWTHGGHPYNEIEDINILCEWNKKSQTSNYYKNAIETWTIRDVNKRNTARKNNLNYLEIFSCDINECISNIISHIQKHIVL